MKPVLRRDQLVESVATYVSGGTPATSVEEYWNGEIPWVTAKDMKTLWLHDSQLRITEAGAEANCRIVPPGTVLVLVRGMTLLKDVPICVTTRPMAFNQDVKALVPGKNVLGEYLALALIAKKHQLLAFVSQAGHGTGVLSTERLGCVRIQVPDLDDQKSLVRLIRLLDDEESMVFHLLALQHKRLTALKQNLFSPDHGVSRLHRVSWKSIRIGALLEPTERRVECHDSTEYPLVSVRRRSEGVFFRGAMLGRDIKTKDLRQIRAGDFLISRRQIVHGASGLVSDDYDGMFVSSSYAALTPRTSHPISMRYFNYFSQTPTFHRLTRIASHGVHIEKLFFDLRDFLRQTVQVPTTLRDQERIADVLDAALAEITLLGQQRHQLRARKLGIIHALFSANGGVRFKVRQ